jgi:hypothetical protein
MSLSRMMLRALACVAIQEQDDDPAPPTMAEDRVFDSRLDPMIFRGYAQPMPGVIVYTDDDEGILLNRGSGGGPYDRMVDLRVEIVIGTFALEVIDNVENVVFDMPMTDAQLEAQLDLFEMQVKWALMSLPNRVHTNAFVAYVKRVESITSHAMRDESGNNRFSARRMHFKCVIADDCPPSFAIVDGPPPAQIPFCEELAKYPAPWITPMLQAMCRAPSMRCVLDVLAGTNNPYTYVPLLKRIGINVDAVNPEADPNLLAAQGKSQGPDGRIEVHTILELQK